MTHLFHYKAVNASGKVQEGSIESNSEEEVIAYLYEQNLIPVNIKKKSSKRLFQKKDPSQASIILNRPDILNFTNACANLLKSGFPIDKAITVVGQTSKSHKKIPRLCQKIFTLLEEGIPLSQALKQSSSQFSSLYLSLIKAGEQSGQLDFIFQRLSQFLEDQHEFRKTVQGILVYPLLVLGVSFASLGILLGFVVPRFITIFEDMGQTLPLLTQVMIRLSQFFRHNFILLGLILLFFILLGLILRQKPSVQIKLHKYLLKTPYFGSLNQRIMIARFASTLQILLDGGLTLLPALRYAQNTIDNRYIHVSLDVVITQVKKGVRIHNTMQKFPLAFPELLIHMLAVGEETGQLQNSLGHISQTFEREVRSSLKTITTILSPLLILCMGIVIALIIAAMLLPLLDATNIDF
jgi:type II secretory pathway component PulF